MTDKEKKTAMVWNLNAIKEVSFHVKSIHEHAAYSEDGTWLW